MPNDDPGELRPFGIIFEFKFGLGLRVGPTTAIDTQLTDTLYNTIMQKTYELDDGIRSSIKSEPYYTIITALGRHIEAIDNAQELIIIRI